MPSTNKLLTVISPATPSQLLESNETHSGANNAGCPDCDDRLHSSGGALYIQGKRTSRVLEYRHEIADDDSTEEVWITAAGGTRKVYGPKQVGYANLARVFWSPNTVYVLRCSAGRTPLALGWVTQSFTPIENDLASSRILSFLNQQEPVTSLDRFCGKTKFPVKMTALEENAFDFPGLTVHESADSGLRPEPGK
jgi:hypothetical protein